MTVRGDLLVLGAKEVAGLLAGREGAVIEAVRHAYLLHEAGHSHLPPSTFLPLPDPTTRIIALTAHLGGDQPVAGVKWISSFPGNVERGIPRASAVIVLNSLDTGRPIALLEGAHISAARTAASAALGAAALSKHKPTTLGLIGCGVINRTVLRYCLLLCPSIQRVVTFDIRPEQAAAVVAEAPLRAEMAPSIAEVCRACDLVSFATVAGTPHVSAEVMHAGVSTILHVSLRDLDPGALATCDNVVDDVDHALRANTSLHLAEQRLGTRSFVRTTIARVLAGTEPARAGEGPTVFSPFGLGVLDLAVARVLVAEASARRVGLRLDGFLEG